MKVCPDKFSSLVSHVRAEHVSLQLVLGPSVGVGKLRVHHGRDHADAGHLVGGGAVGVICCVIVVWYLPQKCVRGCAVITVAYIWSLQNPPPPPLLAKILLMY